MNLGLFVVIRGCGDTRVEVKSVRTGFHGCLRETV